jgi:heat shock protein HslJ
MKAMMTLAVLNFALAALPAHARPPAMRGTQWQLVEMDKAAVPASPPITLTLGSDGTISGSSGCNRYSGRYALRDGNLKLATALAATLMGCADDIASRESRFLALLAAGGRVRVSWEGNFRLTGATGDQLRLRADVAAAAP